MLLRASHRGHIHAKQANVNTNRQEIVDSDANMFVRAIASPQSTYGDHAGLELLPLAVTRRTPEPS